jgi:16S rRNA (guanine1207-N2)-methyltransferase
VSGPSRPLAAAQDPALDPDVLLPAPLIEFGGSGAVARLGGLAVLPWRRDWLLARAAGLAAEPKPPSGPRFGQALVRIQRGRAATEADLAAALAALEPGGLLAVTGPNALGIGGWTRRLRAAFGDPLRVVARAKARVTVFRPASGAAFAAPEPSRVPLADGEARLLLAAPGVFSADGLDRGTALLVAHLRAEPPARRVVDLGCGAGHLGIAALLAWPEATAVLLDGDARAVDSTLENLSALGLASRGVARWWDVSEPVPEGSFELALSNPPAHEGDVVSLAPARALLRAAAAALAPSGRLLVVANRRLPYERELAELGGQDACRLAREAGGFKILETRVRALPGG